MSRLDLRRSAVPACRVEPSRAPTTCAGQARGIVALRAQRGARDWRRTMIELISSVREPVADQVERSDDVRTPASCPASQCPRGTSDEREDSPRPSTHGRGLALASLALVVIAGCSSLVDDPCASGYMLRGGACVERLGPDAMPDGGMPDGTAPDGTTPDGTTPDGTTTDGGSEVPDGSTPDGTTPDRSTPDGSTPDGASPDAGTPDGGTPDAGTPDGGAPDAGTPDGGTPDAPVCAAPSTVCDGTCTDVMTAPSDCGSCGHVCASGICVAGQCAGELVGHVVAIGHDYQQRNAAMARVIGNAAALASTDDLGIAHVTGTATAASKSGTAAALSSALAIMGRASHAVALPAVGAPLTGIDVLVIDAQTGDGATAEALGAGWRSSIDALLARHGVVIVLEGAGGVGHRFAAGAGLFTVATPVDTTGAPAFVAMAGDAVCQQVVSPYLADTTSVVFPGVVGAIATPAGTVVMHLTR